MFSGTSPCAEFLRTRLQIPAGEKCDRIKWDLRLSDTGKYSLTHDWGFHVDNRTYLKKGTVKLGGTWRFTKGRTADPDGVVAQLDPDQPNNLAFALIDPNILHLLDPNKSLAVGDSGASYTLSHTAMASNALPKGRNGLSTDSDEPPETNFSGRTPCAEITKQMKHPVGTDCLKLKWSVDLYRDPRTLAPTTYRLRSTLYRHEPGGTEIIREGKWEVTRGTKNDPKAIVYELDAFRSDGPIFLLKADRNILVFLANDRSLLVGNEDFSYTLNRSTVKRVTTQKSVSHRESRTARRVFPLS